MSLSLANNLSDVRGKAQKEQVLGVQTFVDDPEVYVVVAYSSETYLKCKLVPLIRSGTPTNRYERVLPQLTAQCTVVNGMAAMAGLFPQHVAPANSKYVALYYSSKARSYVWIVHPTPSTSSWVVQFQGTDVSIARVVWESARRLRIYFNHSHHFVDCTRTPSEQFELVSKNPALVAEVSPPSPCTGWHAIRCHIAWMAAIEDGTGDSESVRTTHPAPSLRLAVVTITTTAATTLPRASFGVRTPTAAPAERARPGPAPAHDHRDGNNVDVCGSGEPAEGECHGEPVTTTMTTIDTNLQGHNGALLSLNALLNQRTLRLAPSRADGKYRSPNCQCTCRARSKPKSRAWMPDSGLRANFGRGRPSRRTSVSQPARPLTNLVIASLVCTRNGDEIYREECRFATFSTRLLPSDQTHLPSSGLWLVLAMEDFGLKCVPIVTPDFEYECPLAAQRVFAQGRQPPLWVTQVPALVVGGPDQKQLLSTTSLIDLHISVATVEPKDRFLLAREATASVEPQAHGGAKHRPSTHSEIEATTLEEYSPNLIHLAEVNYLTGSVTITDLTTSNKFECKCSRDLGPVLALQWSCCGRFLAVSRHLGTEICSPNSCDVLVTADTVAPMTNLASVPCLQHWLSGDKPPGQSHLFVTVGWNRAAETRGLRRVLAIVDAIRRSVVWVVHSASLSCVSSRWDLRELPDGLIELRCPTKRRHVQFKIPRLTHVVLGNIDVHSVTSATLCAASDGSPVMHVSWTRDALQDNQKPVTEVHTGTMQLIVSPVVAEHLLQGQEQAPQPQVLPNLSFQQIAPFFVDHGTLVLSSCRRRTQSVAGDPPVWILGNQQRVMLLDSMDRTLTFATMDSTATLQQRFAQCLAAPTLAHRNAAALAALVLRYTSGDTNTRMVTQLRFHRPQRESFIQRPTVRVFAAPNQVHDQAQHTSLSRSISVVELDHYFTVDSQNNLMLSEHREVLPLGAGSLNTNNDGAAIPVFELALPPGEVRLVDENGAGFSRNNFKADYHRGEDHDVVFIGNNERAYLYRIQRRRRDVAVSAAAVATDAVALDAVARVPSQPLPGGTRGPAAQAPLHGQPDTRTLQSWGITVELSESKCELKVTVAPNREPYVLFGHSEAVISYAILNDDPHTIFTQDYQDVRVQPASQQVFAAGQQAESVASRCRGWFRISARTRPVWPLMWILMTIDS